MVSPAAGVREPFHDADEVNPPLAFEVNVLALELLKPKTIIAMVSNKFFMIVFFKLVCVLISKTKLM